MAGWAALRHGISIDRLSVMGYQSEKLYLKLDHRFHLRVQRLAIPRSRTRSSSDSLKKGLDTLHRVLRYFDEIEAEEIRIDGQSYRLIYRDRILYLKGGDYEVAGMIYDRGGSMEIQLPMVQILSRKVTLSGELHYRYRDGRVLASGYYQVPDLNGAFRIERAGKRFSFWIDSEPTASLHRLMGLVNLSPDAREWLLHRLSAHRYRLEYLQGQGELDLKAGRIVPDLATLQGAARLEKVHLRFHDRLKPIDAPSARVVLQEGNLYILLDKPRYGKHPIDGSRAALLNLFDPDRLELLLRLRYHGRVDWQVLKILNTYGIKVALGQKEGKANAKVAIDIPLVKGEVRIRGLARLSPGKLEYRKKVFRIGGGELAFTSRTLRLRSFRIREKLFRGSLDGTINLKRKRGKLRLYVEKFDPGIPVPLLRMTKVRIPAEVSWNEERRTLSFPTLKSSLVVDARDNIRFHIRDLVPWHPYLRGLLRLASGGEILMTGKAGGRWRISGILAWKESPFYVKNGPLTQFPFKVEVAPDGKVSLEAFGGKLKYSSKEDVLQIEGINIDAQKLLTEMKKLDGGKSSGTLTVLGRKSLIRYGPYVLLSDSYRLRKRGQDLDFVGQLGRERLNLSKRGKELKIWAEGIGDRMLHALIHFDGIRNGRYTLHLQGNPEKGYSGEILIRGGVLTGFKAYNRLIAMINTVPALMSFSSPGFSNKGFELKKGTILFTLKGDQLRLGRILLVGKSSTIAGRGTVNLANGRLDVELAIRTAREMGKAISSIPVVGYILFGKDKSLTAGVKITGTLQKPKIHTNPVGEALLYPLDLLRRTLTAPAHLSEPKPDEELLTTPPPAPAAPLPKVPPAREENATAGNSQAF